MKLYEQASMKNIASSIRLSLAISLSKPIIQKKFQEEYNREEDLSVMIVRYEKASEKYGSEIDEIIKNCQDLNVRIISIFDPAYSEILREINDPPVVLYAIGRTELLNKSTCIAIVGTRKSTTYGNSVAEMFSKELCSYGITIVSGLAAGVDVAAHKGALGTGDTIAVLGSGIDIQYPVMNKAIYEKMYKQGLVISEYPPNYPASTYTFPKRNRIIAGLSKGVVIIESKERGGSLITAECALAYNREVFAVPGRLGDENSLGTNHLIQKGAKLVLSVNDIIEEFNWMIPERKTKIDIKYKLSNEEDQLYSVLSLEAIYIDDISEKAKLPINKVMTILSFLEMQGLVKQLPGKRYVRA